MRPTGGPKDTLAPILLYSLPEHQSLNFTGKEITLLFDEYVNGDKIQQKLIVTPITDLKFKPIVKKEEVVLELEGELRDSTTYTFNFLDGITDITEKNPAENLKIAFSTGSYIDSLKVIGKVTELISDKDMGKMTIGIYELTDTLDIFTEKPTYFINTDEYGRFAIENVKGGKYRLVGFLDLNKNLKFDSDTEPYTFRTDTISPSFSPDSIQLKTVSINASELKLISARATGRYFEARYTKPVVKFSSYPDLPASVVGEQDVIRFYNEKDSFRDSTLVILTAYDSLKNNLTDSLYVKFTQSTKSKASFDYILTPSSNSSITLETPITIDFNKPIMYDSILKYTVYIDTFKLEIDENLKKLSQTRASFNLIDKVRYQELIDSLATTITSNDTTITNEEQKAFWLTKIDTKKINLRLPIFKSIENDTAMTKEIEYRIIQPEQVGVVTYNITTQTPSYIVELINAKGVKLRSTKNCTKCIFTNLEPNDYSIRVLIDNNQNGIWEIGNIRQNQMPESVYNHYEYTTLRANWSVEVDVSF